MRNILICGHINLETTLRVDQFPLDYFPVCYPFFGVRSTVAGVGYNITKALTTLGHQTRLLSLIGQDAVGQLVQHSLAVDNLDTAGVLAAMPETCQSVILYDTDGRRQIHTDLKDVQSRPYPPNIFQQYLTWCELAVLGNINFYRSPDYRSPITDYRYTAATAPRKSTKIGCKQVMMVAKRWATAVW